MAISEEGNQSRTSAIKVGRHFVRQLLTERKNSTDGKIETGRRIVRNRRGDKVVRRKCNKVLPDGELSFAVSRIHRRHWQRQN